MDSLVHILKIIAIYHHKTEATDILPSSLQEAMITICLRSVVDGELFREGEENARCRGQCPAVDESCFLTDDVVDQYQQSANSGIVPIINDVYFH